MYIGATKDGRLIIIDNRNIELKKSFVHGKQVLSMKEVEKHVVAKTPTGYKVVFGTVAISQGYEITDLGECTNTYVIECFLLDKERKGEELNDMELNTLEVLREDHKLSS